MITVFMGSIFTRLTEGGPVFMYPLLVLLVTCILLLGKAFLSEEQSQKLAKIVSHLSLFALVWGFLGMMMGLISAFDSISISGGTSFEVLAGGLKIGLLSPSFGMLVFLIARLGLLGLTLKNKNN